MQALADTESPCSQAGFRLSRKANGFEFHADGVVDGNDGAGFERAAAWRSNSTQRKPGVARPLPLSVGELGHTRGEDRCDQFVGWIS